ncbi:alpha/beta hydrolase [Arthrobacter sp. TPD3018]|nr:alpha/beta hydrolase [Sphingomonas sp. TPD3009]PVE61338.1 alpha/beta hydrolase [Arthrobacter sp. TPD3018]PVE85744.1 alpha/beta hydrolase [Sphingomonas melonis]
MFFLHALGASAREWDGVIAALGERYECVSLNLPGFGGSADSECDVAGLIDWFGGEVSLYQPQSWAVIGHSMGGKIATLAAARARDGDARFAGLAAVVLLAASPPAPEPMEEDRRRQMIDWFADGAIDAEDAAQFVDDNSAARLPEPPRARAIADVRRSGRKAWTGWLERGSREDWREAAGQIALPALIVAGGEDGDLGEDAQRRLNLPHYPAGRVSVIDGAAHLLPYEQPGAVAEAIADHVSAAFARALPPAMIALLASDRVSTRTRAVLTARHAAPGPITLLSERQAATLAALIETVLPGAGDPGELARRIDATLAAGQGDGWRRAELPEDGTCWPAALDTLDAMAGGFADADPAGRERCLSSLAAGEAAEIGGTLSPHQMQLWFAEARGEIARQWMALPGTMARVGYDGYAIGGDGPSKQGYVRAAADTLEPWQRPADTRA